MLKFLRMTKEMEMGIKKRDQAIKEMQLVDNLQSKSLINEQINISFSPTAQEKQKNKFLIKPTTINYFTGGKLNRQNSYDVKLPAREQENGGLCV